MTDGFILAVQDNRDLLKVRYGYDANGSRMSISDVTGSSNYVYDPFGELTSATNGAGQITGYGYNADGVIASVTYPLPSGASWATTSTVNYTHDNADQLTKVTDFNGNAITIGRTADGLPNSVVLGPRRLSPAGINDHARSR